MLLWVLGPQNFRSEKVQQLHHGSPLGPHVHSDNHAQKSERTHTHAACLSIFLSFPRICLGVFSFFCFSFCFSIEASTKRQRGGWRDEVLLAWRVILQPLLFCYQTELLGRCETVEKTTHQERRTHDDLPASWCPSGRRRR